jgi:hypothetical protein
MLGNSRGLRNSVAATRSACLIQCGFNEGSNCAAFQLVSQNERRFKVPDHPVTLLFEDGHGDR